MITELVSTFEGTLKFVEESVADLSEQQMVEQPPGVPNHATWTLGHIITSCQGIAAELGAERWLPNDWESIFGYGSQPSPDLSYYPTKAEMLDALTEAAKRLCQVLFGIKEAMLRQPLPDAPVPTMGHLLFQVVVAHTAFHGGQLAVWRRAIGKPSVAVFV